MPRFLFPLLLVFPLQVLSETILDTSSPILVAIFPVGVALRPVPPALPCLGARHHRVISKQLERVDV